MKESNHIQSGYHFKLLLLSRLNPKTIVYKQAKLYPQLKRSKNTVIPSSNGEQFLCLELTQAQMIIFILRQRKSNCTWWKSPDPEPAELPEVLLTRTGTLSIIRRSLTSRSSSSSLKTTGVYSTIALDAAVGGRGGFEFPGAGTIRKSLSLGLPVDILGIYKTLNFHFRPEP